MQIRTNAEGAALDPMPFVYGGVQVTGVPIMYKDQPIVARHTAEDVMPYGQVFEVNHPRYGKQCVLYEVVTDPVPGQVHLRRDGKPQSRCQLMYLRRNKKSIFHFPVESNPDEQCVNRSMDLGEERVDLYLHPPKSFTYAQASDVIRIQENAEKNAAEANTNKRSKDPVDVMATLLTMMKEGIVNNPGAGVRATLAAAEAEAREALKVQQDKKK